MGQAVNYLGEVDSINNHRRSAPWTLYRSLPVEALRE